MIKPQFIAHRGAALPGRRENSLLAFERAATSQRFAFIELDVRRTRTDEGGERVPIIAHDSSTDALYESQRVPLKDRSHPGVELSGLTYDLLRADSLEVTTLREALRALDGHPVILEILDEAALNETLDLIKEFVGQTTSKWRLEHFVVGSYNPSVLRKTRELQPKTQLMYFYGPRNIGNLPFSLIKELKVDFLHVYKWFAPLIAPIVRLGKQCQVFVFTVNSRLGTQFFSLFGAQGVTTDLVTLPEEF